MGLYILMGALAAFGLLCALWALFGSLFSSRPYFVTLCFCSDADSAFCAISRWKWLRGMGFADGKLLLVDCGLTEREKHALSSMDIDIGFCLPSTLAETLELERNELD